MELLTNTSKQLGNTLIVITHNEEIALRADRQFSITDGNIQEVK